MARLLLRQRKSFSIAISNTRRDSERERQRWIVFAGLDCIDALTRNVEALSEIGLAPIALRAQHFEPVLHTRWRQLRNTTARLNAPTITSMA